MLEMQSEAARQVIAAGIPDDTAIAEWSETTQRLQRMWMDFHAQEKLPEAPAPLFVDPAQWMGMMQAWYSQVPLLDPERQQALWQEGIALWEDILAQYGIGGSGAGAASPIRPGASSRSSR
jgi:polyhydroxyalkanoate synthase